MPHAYWRRNLNSLKRRSRSKRHKRFSASVLFLRSWRAKSRAAAVRVRCLPYCARCPLTLTLSPDGGEGISRALPLLLVAIVRLDSQFSAEQRIYFLLDGYEILVNAPTTPKMRVEETLALPTLSPRRGGSTQRVPEIFTPVVVALLHGDLCPWLSTRYSTASPVNGALNDLDDDPAAIEFCDIVCPLA